MKFNRINIEDKVVYKDGLRIAGFIYFSYQNETLIMYGYKLPFLFMIIIAGPLLFINLHWLENNNPILNQEGYSYAVKSKLGQLYDPGLLLSCGNYYLGKNSEMPIQEKCAQFIKNAYIKLLGEKLIPTNSTLEDLKDQRLWRIILQPNDSKESLTFIPIFIPVTK